MYTCLHLKSYLQLLSLSDSSFGGTFLPASPNHCWCHPHNTITGNCLVESTFEWHKSCDSRVTQATHTWSIFIVTQIYLRTCGRSPLVDLVQYKHLCGVKMTVVWVELLCSVEGCALSSLPSGLSASETLECFFFCPAVPVVGAMRGCVVPCVRAMMSKRTPVHHQGET